MLDKQDLQAIKELMDTSIATAIAASEQRMAAKIKESSDETMRGSAALMEQYFEPKFNLLSENQQLILEKLDGKVDKEDCQNSMSVVAAAIRTHSRDIEELKAQ